MKPILRCTRCDAFTLKEVCRCGGKAITIKPPKYSKDYKYAEYRREAKKESRKTMGLL